MSCRHAKGGMCTNLACPRAGQSVWAGAPPCSGCDFAEAPGERRESRPAPKQLAVERYTGPIPDGAVRCLRCGRPCKTGSPDPKAAMLRKSTSGFCLDCAVTDWLRNTYPVNLLLGAAPLLGTKAARHEQEQWDAHWDDADDWSSPTFAAAARRTERLEEAIGPALRGDTSTLDALVAEKEAAEARREQGRRERAERRPESKLLIPAIREQFAEIMQAAFAQARPEDIGWEWIVDNWALPFPKTRGNKGACRP